MCLFYLTESPNSLRIPLSSPRALVFTIRGYAASRDCIDLHPKSIHPILKKSPNSLHIPSMFPQIRSNPVQIPLNSIQTFISTTCEHNLIFSSFRLHPWLRPSSTIKTMSFHPKCLLSFYIQQKPSCKHQASFSQKIKDQTTFSVIYRTRCSSDDTILSCFGFLIYLVQYIYSEPQQAMLEDRLRDTVFPQDLPKIMKTNSKIILFLSQIGDHNFQRLIDAPKRKRHTTSGFLSDETHDYIAPPSHQKRPRERLHQTACNVPV